MRETKVHEHEKEIVKKLKGHKKILLIGPLSFSKNLLLEVVGLFKPTIVIFIDGGLIHKKKLKEIASFSSEISLGDGDSGKLRPDYLLPAEKDFSDLAFALSCLEKSKTRIAQIQLLGLSHINELRPDHFLSNLGELENFVLQKGIPAILYRNELSTGRILICPSGKTDFKARSIFSLMTLRKNKIKITGKASYQLKEWTDLPVLSSLGLSNSGTGKVTVESKAPVIIFQE